MTSFTRKTIMGICAAAVLGLGASAAASAATTMNLGWAVPLDTRYGLFATKFKELAESYTQGDVKVKLRPSGQIGGEDEAFSALQLGTIDGYMITANNIAPHFPLIDVLGLPYIFTGREHAVQVFDGDIGDDIKQALYKSTGVHMLSFNTFDYRDMYTTKRPINTMADMAGLKIRVPKNEVMIATYKAFGAEPVPLAWSETPTALQTGAIDAGDNGTEVIVAMKFYEFAKNLVILEHFGASVPLFVSDRFMSRLSKDNADAVRRAAREAEAFQRQEAGAQTELMRKTLVENGMTMTTPDKAEFIKAGREVQDTFVEKRGPEFKALVERIRVLAEGG